jgi:hypothetical protein
MGIREPVNGFARDSKPGEDLPHDFAPAARDPLASDLRADRLDLSRSSRSWMEDRSA